MPTPTAPTIPPIRPGVEFPPYYTQEDVQNLQDSWAKYGQALEDEIEALRDQIPTPQPAIGRFPGDPGPGKAVFGVAPGQDSRKNLELLEAAVGGKLAFRVYNGGSADFAVPNGVLAKTVLTDIAAGRPSVISPKPGIEKMAAHDPALKTAIIKWLQWRDQQPGMTFVIIHHEGENDWKADFNNLTKYKQHQADYRSAQRWFRDLMNEAKSTKVCFIGSLLSYSWSNQGRTKFGDPEGWNPGKQANGKHVWDVACLDHYLPAHNGTTLENQQWLAAVNSIKGWGCLLGITENGVNWGNPNGGKILSAFIKKFVEQLGGVIYLYFSSNAGQGGKPQVDQKDWWILTDANGSKPAFIEAYKKYNKTPSAK